MAYVAYVHTILGKVFHHNGSWKIVHLRCQSNYITYTFVKMQEMMQINWVLSDIHVLFLSVICLCSTLIRRFQDKLSIFFFLPSRFQTSSSSLSASTQLFSQTSHLIEHGQKKKYISESLMRGSDHHPAWSVTEFISCSNISALQTSSLRKRRVH